MYCNRCGSELNAGAQFCPKCGKQVLPGAVPPMPATNAPVTAAGRVQRHIAVLAVLWIVSGGLRLLQVFAFAVAGRWVLPAFLGHQYWAGWGIPFRWGAWPFPIGLAGIGVMLGVFAILYLVLGWGLYEKRAWARPLGLVLGFLSLLRFPLGTALGIYTLWVLLPETSRREYEAVAVR
jgi:hypothetical protein